MMNVRSGAVGRAGEDYCVKLLRRQGWKILARNYRVGRYETDIIADDGEYIVFIEVKTRCSDPKQIYKYGSGADAVDAEKLRGMKTAANVFFKKYHRDFTGRLPRLDVMEVYGKYTGNIASPLDVGSVHHIKNVRL